MALWLLERRGGPHGSERRGSGVDNDVVFDVREDEGD